MRRKSKYLITIVFIVLATALCHAASTDEPQAIYPATPSAVDKLAASEVQKYVYLRTGKLLPVFDSLTCPE